jgi:hypothetical protein
MRKTDRYLCPSGPDRFGRANRWNAPTSKGALDYSMEKIDLTMSDNLRAGHRANHGPLAGWVGHDGPPWCTEIRPVVRWEPAPVASPAGAGHGATDFRVLSHCKSRYLPWPMVTEPLPIPYRPVCHCAKNHPPHGTTLFRPNLLRRQRLGNRDRPACHTRRGDQACTQRR